MNRWTNRLAAVVVAVVAVAALGAARASADDAALQADGMQAVTAWVAAVASGDKDRVAAILAPEFQIVRDNGVAYDRDQYLASGLPKIAGTPKVDELVATMTGDVLVVRYVVILDATVSGGAAMQARAPRLTVFRRDGDKWLVSAHANFAAIGK
jgi:ketosteroid isomerase-like protein